MIFGPGLQWVAAECAFQTFMSGEANTDPDEPEWFGVSMETARRWWMRKWRDEVAEFGCYRCGHEASATDPCDEGCDGLVPLNWTQMQQGRAA